MKKTIVGFTPLEREQANLNPIRRRKFSNRIKEQNSLTGFTLIELILALALLGVIILGVTAFDVASREFLRSSRRKAQVLNEAVFVLEHIAKRAVSGIGDISNPAIGQGITPAPYNEPMFYIFQDTHPNPNPNGILDIDRSDPLNPANPSNLDIPIGYAQQSVAGGGEEVIFMCPNARHNHRAGDDGGPGRHEILTRRARPLADGGGFNFTINRDPPVTGIPVSVTIKVTLRYDPWKPKHMRNNPEATAETTISVPGYSLN
ncbi:MAG: prepilin-type N-terminal cleavage/methylation domain-containing protein [Candidatus Omnitrophica bacterium]|nr:prepilin-type N-terminal cleavage/methylation domain-containing protein [Candidatus Omnitrophota bacterium]